MAIETITETMAGFGRTRILGVRAFALVRLAEDTRFELVRA